MSLDVYLYSDVGVHPEHTEQVRWYEANITHNLTEMAEKAGIYYVLWRPEEINAVHAADILPVLRQGLAELAMYPDKYKAFNPKNGWGTYEGLINFTKNYIEACEKYPLALIEVWR